MLNYKIIKRGKREGKKRKRGKGRRILIKTLVAPLLTKQ
jgi:hypothetical protein